MSEEVALAAGDIAYARLQAEHVALIARAMRQVELLQLAYSTLMGIAYGRTPRDQGVAVAAQILAALEELSDE